MTSPGSGDGRVLSELPTGTDAPVVGEPASAAATWGTRRDRWVEKAKFVNRGDHFGPSSWRRYRGASGSLLRRDTKARYPTRARCRRPSMADRPPPTAATFRRGNLEASGDPGGLGVEISEWAPNAAPSA